MIFNEGDSVRIINVREDLPEHILGAIGIVYAQSKTYPIYTVKIMFGNVTEYYSIPHDCLAKDEEEELEQVLIANDKELKLKAEKYDKICDTFFMATGIIEDGDSIKYIIEPEEVLDAILKVILEGLNNEKYIEAKRHYIRREIC